MKKNELFVRELNLKKLDNKINFLESEINNL